MKKKIYFIVGAIIQIIASVYSIIKAKEIVQNLLATLNTLPEAIQERVNNLYQNAGNKYIIVMASVCIILDLVIILIATRDKLAEKKGVMIALSIFTPLTNHHTVLILLFSIIW